MTLGRLTRLGRSELEEEMAKLRETIAELESILASDVKLRGVIADEIAAIRDKYAERSPDPDRQRPGRARHRGPDRRRGHRHHHDPGRLREVGRRRRLPRPGPRRARGAGGQAARRGLRRPDRPHHHARLPAAVLEPGPGLPPAGPRDPDEGAHRQGHGHRQPAEPAAERVDPGDRDDQRLPDQDKFLVFATANGR